MNFKNIVTMANQQNSILEKTISQKKKITCYMVDIDYAKTEFLAMEAFLGGVQGEIVPDALKLVNLMMLLS